MKTLIKFLIPCTALVAACQKTPSAENGSTAVNFDTGSLSHEMIVLGDRLDDPYSVDNMTKALARLYPTKAGIVPLDATDLYVRFLPADEQQLDAVIDSGIQLLDHPFDYEIIREGDWYHDPDVPDSCITWQYAVVPKGYEAPDGIEFEVLDEVYLPDNSATKAAGVDWDEVEREAFRISGNGGMLASETKGGTATAVPSGKLTIVDSDYSPEPFGIAGVRVQCNVFVKFDNAFTDADGCYTMSKSFASNPRYRVVFHNVKGFRIGFNLIFTGASVCTLGEHSPDGVSLNVSEMSDAKLFRRSVVNNAGWEYYDSCVTDDYKIAVPPANLRIWLFGGLSASSAVMMHQGAIVKEGFLNDILGDYSIIVQLFAPDVTIGLDGKTGYEAIWRSAIHEFAHASHFRKAGVAYWDNLIEYMMLSYFSSGGTTYGTGTEDNAGYCEVSEMWAYYVENVFYQDRYGYRPRIFGGSFWFSPQVLLYMDERGLDRYRIFAALGSDVDSRLIFKERLLGLYPEYKSTINQAFSRY